MHSTDKTPGTDATNMAARSIVDASQVRSGMPIVCSKGGQFGVVDHMEGKDTVKVNKDDHGMHHYFPLSWVTRVDDKVHVDRPGEQAMREWKSRPPTV